MRGIWGMGGDRSDGRATRPTREPRIPPARTEETGLAHPRAVDILTTEHWSLLSSRNLGYQEMFGRATIFIAVVSALVVALALLAQATRFGREALLVTALLIAVALFVGLTTFARAVAINYEDARWVHGMSLLRQAYFEIAPGLEAYFVTDHDPDADPRQLAHGSPQRIRNLAASLTTTSSVVATLNSVLAGALAGDLVALAGARLAVFATAGAAVSIVSGFAHVRVAARFRRRHAASTPPAKLGA